MCISCPVAALATHDHCLSLTTLTSPSSAQYEDQLLNRTAGRAASPAPTGRSPLGGPAANGAAQGSPRGQPQQQGQAQGGLNFGRRGYLGRS